MSEIRDAIDAILRVQFRQISPAETAKIGDFLERAAEEVSAREHAVAEREANVSARESAAELREGALQAQVKALASVQRVRAVLDLNATSAKPKRVGWLRN